MDFLSHVFDAVERGEREARDDGSIAHAEVQIGDSVVMLSDATPQYPARPCVNFTYVEDVEGMLRKAVAAGASPHPRAV
jgi:PhnB protein